MKYPADIQAAANEWGANCGPCSLAAVLECAVADVKPLVVDFKKRPWMNPTQMKAALERAGIAFRSISGRMPRHGLLFIQWGGHEAKHVYAQYKFTHWIAVDARLVTEGLSSESPDVFEVNAPYLVTWQEWEREMSRISKDAGWGNGTFFFRTGLELDIN